MGKRGLEKDMKSPDHDKPREQTQKQQTEEQQTIGEQRRKQQWRTIDAEMKTDFESSKI